MHTDEPVDPVLATRLVTMRVIHAALSLGCLTFFGIAMLVRLEQELPNQEFPTLSLVAIAIAALNGMAALVVTHLLGTNWRDQAVRRQGQLAKRSAYQGIGEADPRAAIGSVYWWWQIYQVRMILIAALFEGTIFLQLLAYLIEGSYSNLGVAGFFFLLLLTLHPTRPRVESWIQNQKELVESSQRTLF